MKRSVDSLKHFVRRRAFEHTPVLFTVRERVAHVGADDPLVDHWKKECPC